MHQFTATSMPINKADYVYNLVGNRTSLTDRRGNQAFGYDQLDRTTSASHPLLLDSPGAMEQPYTYTGWELDQETGLYYYRARYYDVATGRFLQKDPMGLNGGQLHVYAYVANNPMRYIDPVSLRLVWPSSVFPKDRGEIERALDYLRRDSGMAKIIQNLDDSSTIYTIIPSGYETNQYDGAYNQILWNPYLANCLIGGGTQSPALILGHELAHAEGGILADILRQFPDPEFGTKEERRVITGPETRAALTLGEGVRSSHGVDRQYNVPSSMSR